MHLRLAGSQRLKKSPAILFAHNFNLCGLIPRSLLRGG